MVEPAGGVEVDHDMVVAAHTCGSVDTVHGVPREQRYPKRPEEIGFDPDTASRHVRDDQRTGMRSPSWTTTAYSLSQSTHVVFAGSAVR